MRMIAIVLACALAGCVANQPTLPSHPNATFSGSQKIDYAQINAVVDRIRSANQDICDVACRIPVHVIPAGLSADRPFGMGTAWARGDGYILLSDFFVLTVQAYDRDVADNNMAQTIGHEIAHFLLGHMVGMRPSSQTDLRRREDSADCLGAILAARSGYRGDGFRPMSRFINEPSYHSPDNVRDAAIADASRRTKALMGAGRPIDKAAIKEICGVSW